MAEPTDRCALLVGSSVEGKGSAAFADAERVLVAFSVVVVIDALVDFVDAAAPELLVAVSIASVSAAPAIAALATPFASAALVVAFAAFAAVLAVSDTVGIFRAAPYAVVLPSAFAAVVVVVVVLAGGAVAVAGVEAAVEVVVAVVEPVDFAVERSSELDRVSDWLLANRAVLID